MMFARTEEILQADPTDRRSFLKRFVGLFAVPALAGASPAKVEPITWHVDFGPYSVLVSCYPPGCDRPAHASPEASGHAITLEHQGPSKAQFAEWAKWSRDEPRYFALDPQGYIVSQDTGLRLGGF